MRINNFGEFKTFLVDNKLDDLDSTVADFIACVMQYSVFCSCKKAQKNQKHEICNQQYTHVVLHVMTSKKDVVFSKIADNLVEFYYNQNYHITTISR